MTQTSPLSHRRTVRAVHHEEDTTSQGRAARALTLIAGVAFLVVGVVGFIVTGFRDFASHDSGHSLLGLELNGLHNTAHVVFGIAGVLLWRTVRGARAFAAILILGYAAVLAFGIVAEGEDWNVLSINAADNWLHLGLIVVGAVIAGLFYRASHPTPLG